MAEAPTGWVEWRQHLLSRVEDLASGRVDLDPATRRRAALVLVDDLAAMVVAAAEPQVVALSAAAARAAPIEEATTVTGVRSGRAWAAMVNATAANWSELDEGYRPATCHGGLYALPAAMAEAEARCASLGDLLRALVVGYEVSTALARVLVPPRPFVLHPHATLSPVGAAAAIAALRVGDGGPGIGAAVDVAMTLAAVGPFEHASKGVLVRNGWAGHGAMAGFTAVELAGAGIHADAEAPLAVLQRALGYPVAEEELAERPARWAIHDGYHKSYACCQYVHSAVEATLELIAGPLADTGPGDITSIVIESHPLAMALDETSPTTVLGGKFSLPHAVSAVLARRHAGQDTFSAAHLADADVARLRGLVSITPYSGQLQPPHDRPARVTVTTASRTWAAECLSAAGGPDRPLTDADVVEKAARLTRDRMPSFAEVAHSVVEHEIEDSTPWPQVQARLWSR